MKLILTKNQKLVTNAAGKEGKSASQRPILGYVHVSKGIIEAADGYLFVRKKLDYDGKDILLSKKVATQDKEIETDYNESRTFPNTASLIPSGKPVFRIGLNRNLLKKMLSALDKSKETEQYDLDTPLRFSFYGEHSPVKVEIPEENTVAMLMPMQIKDWEDK